jgi:alpha-tubulin suppressor-like RCC1 family protein
VFQVDKIFPFFAVCSYSDPCISLSQAATGLSFTVILTRDGQVYTCGSNTHGQLGHGDTTDRATPKMVELFEGSGQVVQVAAGASYTFAVIDDGTVHSFGSCTNFCLGHGDQHDELRPRAMQSFKRRNIHVICVSAGDEHAVALDALGCVSLYCPVCIHLHLLTVNCSTE